MTPDEMKALVQRFYDEGWNNGDLSVYDELVAEDFTEYPGVPGLEGREGFRQLNVMFKQAVPDMNVTVDQLVAEGDRIACRWTSTGTQTGELFGIPATGNELHVTATLIYRVEDGRLKEGWINRDDLGLMRQLGVVPTPGAEE